MPAALTYPPRITLKPGMTRDLYCDFQQFAEVVPTGSTAASGEDGEGQAIESGTATLAWEGAVSPAVPVTIGSATVTGTKLVATVTVPTTADVGTYSVLWVAVTDQDKQLSDRVYLDVKYA